MFSFVNGRVFRGSPSLGVSTAARSGQSESFSNVCVLPAATVVLGEAGKKGEGSEGVSFTSRCY